MISGHQHALSCAVEDQSVIPALDSARNDLAQR
jgi:hypothetical protein